MVPWSTDWQTLDDPEAIWIPCGRLPGAAHLGAPAFPSFPLCYLDEFPGNHFKEREAELEHEILRTEVASAVTAGSFLRGNSKL